MQERNVTETEIRAYQEVLRQNERAEGTVEKYMHDVRAFAAWLAGRPMNKEVGVQWKEYLQQEGYAPATVNSMIAAVNGLLRFLGWEDCRMRFLRVQRRLFRAPERELTRKEYERLLDVAHRERKERLALLMETICATGIRVSEVRYITVAAARAGRADIDLKGKIRTILLPHKLCRKLMKYAAKEKIASGALFRTESGKCLDRRQIWAELKALCRKAGVEATKVFSHNLRHLFATVFYRACRDIAKLADVLGHSSIETTRIYLATSGEEHIRQLDQLGLVS